MGSGSGSDFPIGIGVLPPKKYQKDNQNLAFQYVMEFSDGDLRTAPDASYSVFAAEEKPIYTLDENAAVKVMQRFQRQVSANVYVRALRRDRLRVAKEEQERKELEEAQESGALAIQCMVRRKLAYNVMKQKKADHMKHLEQLRLEREEEERLRREE